MVLNVTWLLVNHVKICLRRRLFEIDGVRVSAAKLRHLVGVFNLLSLLRKFVSTSDNMLDILDGKCAYLLKLGVIVAGCIAKRRIVGQVVANALVD